MFFLRLLLRLFITGKELRPPRSHVLELLEEDLPTEAAHVLSHLRHEIPREDPRHVWNLVGIGDNDEWSPIRLVVDRSDLEVLVKLFDVVSRDLARCHGEWLAYIWKVIERH